MILELKFSDRGEWESFKKLEPKIEFPYTPSEMNDEFQTAVFEVSDQPDADDLERGLLDELEPRSYITYSFQSI